MNLLSIVEKHSPAVCKPVFERVKRSPIGKRIAVGTFWSVVGAGLARGFGFIAMILVARILGREVFGEFGFIRSTATTFVAFSSFGMGLTATKYIAELLHTDKDRAGRIIGLSYLFTFFSSFAVALIFYFSVPWLCETKLGLPHLVGPMRLGAILLFLTTISGTQVSVMTGFQDFRGLATTNFLGGLTMAPIYVVGAYFGGLWGVVIAAIVAMALNLAINCAFIYRNTRKHAIRYAFAKAYKELPILWKSNVPLVSSGVIHALIIWMTQLMLAGQINSATEMGAYYVVLNYQVIMFFLPQQLTTTVFPILSEQSGMKHDDKFMQIARKTWMLNMAATIIVVLPFVIFSKWFMGLNGAEYVDAYFILLIACIAAFINSLTSMTSYILLSRGNNWTHCFIVATSLTICLMVTHVSLQNGFGGASPFIGYGFSQIIYALLALRSIRCIVKRC